MRLGEDALLLRLGDGIDADTNARVHALAARIDAARPPWLRDLVPAYASLALFVDASACDGDDPLADAEAWLHALPPDDGDPASSQGALHEVPVRYGGEHGPDLDAVAEHAGLSPRQVIELHADGEYRVAMLGFAPGFPYLLGLDPALSMPRLATPRTRVEAGSVGIGGEQAGIYPRPGPGGWRIIGRTEVVLFDPARDPPSLLAPGDRLRFVPTGKLP
ncbi:5-oxoprolinase subunit PxpB [Pseudoluteimonas lycopersici]|uniref:5-oxoprolinase subunit PxpB n=2 Tax=Pseudoluteimonas lycopersici TaxID=1324796 RepID=A0A516V860_9GAMM|nr:5-oxoprolinase subunit PxpB [Lysobacter lycopersici]